MFLHVSPASSSLVSEFGGGLMSTPTPAPDNNTTSPPPLTVSAPQLDNSSSTPPPADLAPSPVSASPPPPDTQSPPPASTSRSSPPPPASAPPPDTDLPPPASTSPPPFTAPAPPNPAVSPPPPPSTSSSSPPLPSTSSPFPPPPSTSSPPPSTDFSPPPSTSSPPATSASPPSSSSPPPTSSASPPPHSTSSPPSSPVSPPPPSTSSPLTSASSPPSTSPPPAFSGSPPPPSTFPPSPSTLPPPPSASSSPTSSSSPTPPHLTSSPPSSTASPTSPPFNSSPPTSSTSSTPTPSSFLPSPSSAFPPPPPSTSSTSPKLLLSPPPPLSSGSTPVDSSWSGISVAVVVGTAIGGVAILLVLTLLFVCYRQKRRNHDADDFHAQPPFAGYKDHGYGAPPPLPGRIARLKSNASAPLRMNAYAPPFLQSSFGSTGSRCSAHETPPPPSPGSVLGSSKSSFGYEQLSLATNGFSEANLLGQGGFGYVHRGVLPNGKEVAIKQLKAGSGQGEREFQAEVDIITRVHHKHLVSLVGYCITGSQRLLVYEYIPNNNLEFHLHEKGRPTMDWSARVRIALGSAKGLAYLHEDCNPKIIHRDIKAANILLDFKFEAKVADFGLAKFTSDIHTHISTRVMGTFGYLAPEYASSGKLSEKSDVFSFGVVLLELITGHRPVDTTQTFMEDSLVDWARPLLVGAIEDENYDGLADPKMQGNFIPTEMARMVACAAACVRHSAKRRPRMSQVVRALEGDATLADLNKGVRAGPDESSDYDTTQYEEDMKKYRKMVLESHEYGASGVAYSAATSEYGLYPSSSSSSDATQTSREIKMTKSIGFNKSS